MRGRVTLVITFVVVLVVLVVLNAASYVKVEREAELEFRPDRSTTNAGPTGTRALYDFLQQSGQRVGRWTRPTAELLRSGDAGPETFVVIGQLRVPFKRDEARALLRWVERGGRLVIIDRSPDSALTPASQGWRVSSELFDYPDMQSRPEDLGKMTAGVKPVAPAQPTFLTRDVESILPSRFASRLHTFFAEQTDADAADDVDDWWSEDESDPPPPRPTPAGGTAGPVVRAESPHLGAAAVEVYESPRAPVSHITDWRGGPTPGALLVDYAYGHGRIVILSDPYIVANSGIRNADNLQLAANVVTGAGGLVVFDEFHQGLGSRSTGALGLFAGTPVLWIFGQAGFVVLLFLWSRGRRFARALPAPHVDRRSKLEFVASMAELQQRARAYDLAVENIYARTRRALARYGGLDPSAAPAEIAARVAARSGKDRAQVEGLLEECDDVLRGGRPKSSRAVALVRHLRELERDLGIRMRAREIRQKEKGKR